MKPYWFEATDLVDESSMQAFYAHGVSYYRMQYEWAPGESSVRAYLLQKCPLRGYTDAPMAPYDLWTDTANYRAVEYKELPTEYEAMDWCEDIDTIVTRAMENL